MLVDARIIADVLSDRSNPSEELQSVDAGQMTAKPEIDPPSNSSFTLSDDDLNEFSKPVGWAEKDALASARVTFRAGKTGRQKRGACPLWTGSSPKLCNALSFWLCHCLRLLFASGFVLRGELLLDLEGNGIGVHLVRPGCGAENLTAVRLPTR
jgi:hypothetical protein